ncbi:uncharacterized protein LOC110887473 [Helianthus annuus]|uniref:uncharacterized protein LOC110887473 n=1 Tax=Helianthus annuus TaxID=4232 RepID=UPI000B8F73CF|nr:uncharacterized protein LOC110887473 [Helianthus annuus]
MSNPSPTIPHGLTQMLLRRKKSAMDTIAPAVIRPPTTRIVRPEVESPITKVLEPEVETPIPVKPRRQVVITDLKQLSKRWIFHRELDTLLINDMRFENAVHIGQKIGSSSKIWGSTPLKCGVVRGGAHWGKKLKEAQGHVTPRFPRVSPVGPVGDYRDVVGNNIVKPHNI